MNYQQQKPINADGDSAGQVLAFNAATKRWYVVSWPTVDGKLWTDWQPLPPAPVKVAAVTPVVSTPGSAD
jgi:hypothetical protein